MPGPHRTLALAIAASRKRTPRYRVPFPDLRVEQRTAPCSNVIATNVVCTRRSALPEGAVSFPIGHSHKQSLEMITPGMMQHLEWMGGKKS